MVKKKEEKKTDLMPVSIAAKELGIPAYALGGIMQKQGWKQGKQVSLEELKKANQAFKQHKME